jgi:signal peptidase I
VVRFVQLRSVASLVLQLAILLALIAAFFVRFWPVSGPSMAPHISSGEYVFINTLAYKFVAPRRGDVVAFHHDAEFSSETYIKRVIAVPGDRVRIDRGAVYVDGALLSEPYVEYNDTRSMAEITVPPQTVFVLGDNRAVSEDSRAFGPVRDGDLVGRALLRVWPPGAL